MSPVTMSLRSSGTQIVRLVLAASARDHEEHVRRGSALGHAADDCSMTPRMTSSLISACACRAAPCTR
jgi:hypothetical protein